MTEPSAPEQARLLAGRYRLDRLLAVGGMGEVWRATDELLGRPVAVKLLKPEYVEDPTFLERFRAEARLAAGLSHPGIAGVFDYGEQPARAGMRPVAFLVMELVEGEPLSALLAREGPLDPAATLDLLGQAALALQAAHEGGVVHRDVKPGNLLVRPDGTVKVTDFGIARGVGTTTLTEAGTVLGTAYYLSPEQGSGGRASHRSDLYALGVVGYECLAGHRPFVGDNPLLVALAHQRENPPPLPGSVPAPVAQLIAAAMARSPQDRPDSAGIFAGQVFAVRSRLYGPPRGAAAVAAESLASAVLGAPTRVADTQFGRGAAAAGATRLLTGLAPARRRRQPLRAPLIGLALLLVLLLAALLRPHPRVATIAVPKLVGMSQAAASALLTRDQLHPVISRAASTRYPAGEVAAVRPAPGTRLRRGQPVTLTVSAGAPRVTVAALAYLGKPEAQVVAALAALGLRPSVSQAQRGAAGPAVGTGNVAAVHPTGSVLVGSTVSVVVESAGGVTTGAGSQPAAPAGPTAPAPGMTHDHGKGKDHGGN